MPPFQKSTPPSDWIVLVHGGAGDVAPERRHLHAEGCALAAEAGASVLRAGGTALAAVEAAVRVLEDDPKFNAGTGACLNEDGDVELDASIMDGASLRAGAVAALPPFKNPISIARAALEDGRHVMYAGDGAARFAGSRGFSPAAPGELRTDAAVERLAQVRAGKAASGWAGGTVGAVARDAQGHVAAATSTGGMVDKRAGRVGDSPVVGAGTYADDETGAASTTGTGESFLRTAFAARVVEGLSGADVAADVGARLDAMSARVGGTGGVIVVDRTGRGALARNTASMSFALVRKDAGGEHAEQGS